MNFWRALPLKRFTPVLAFFGGFIWDLLTLGQKMTPLEFLRLWGMLMGAALIVHWLAYRHTHDLQEPSLDDKSMAGRWRRILWRAPELLLPFFFGSIFCALFILYFKSSGHFGAWLVGIALGALLVANEFWHHHYVRGFTLNWSLFALCAILLMNFSLPHALGSIDPRWFPISTAMGAGLTYGLYRLTPGRPGKVFVVWLVALVLYGAWQFDMIAPVPLVKRSIAIGQNFSQGGGDFVLQVEAAEPWQFWSEQSNTVHVGNGARVYGVSSVFAPRGVLAPLEHRWQRRNAKGEWVAASTVRFTASGGREGGFRGYSYVTNPTPGDWRLIVATQDGHTIATTGFSVAAGAADEWVERRL